MKATVNGIDIEGTPQEIMEFERLMKNGKPRTDIPHQPTIGMPDLIDKTGWNHQFFKTITTTGIDKGPYPTAGKCSAAMNGGCYCTGACQT
jgi:hypothetical protein